MSKINIDELYKKLNKRNDNEKKIFFEILNKIHSRIKYSAELEQTYCIYNVPTFILGTPLYNHSKLKIFLYNELKNNGFILKYFNNLLLISWDDVKIKKNNNIKKNENNFKEIKDFNSNGLFFDKNILESIDKKSQNLKF